MKRGSLVIGAMALAGVGALGILEVTAAPQRDARQRNNNSVAVQPNSGRVAQSEGGVAGGSTQPNVTASRIGLNSSGNSDDIAYYGTSGGIRAFSLASTSCNVGNQAAEWIPGGRNPVIAQNLYRYREGKFEQIAMSWLKHSFCAVSEPTCGSCSSTPCSSLGIGCADTYWATLNGDNNDMGPRWHINPQGFGPGGVHNDIYNNPVGNNIIRGRLQVKDADIIAGSQYVAEIQYVCHDEPYNMRYNNASYRFVNVSPTSMTGVGAGQASVAMGKAAIQAWKAIDPGVSIAIGNDLSPSGYFNLGVRVYDNGDGTFDYEYALHNLNSYRGAQSFSVPVADNVDVTNIGFHDVDYHSGDGENYVTRDGTDWPGMHANGEVKWQTSTHAQNPNANALLWGTLYNFRFTANVGPVAGDAGIALFRPSLVAGGSPPSITIATSVPGEIVILCPADMVGADFNPPGDGVVDGADLSYLLGEWGPNPGSPADFVDGTTFAPPPDGIVDGADLAYFLGEWGPCN